MDNTYSGSKTEIFNWIATYFKININKAEQASNGALYCKIIDTLHPGKILMHKVNWNAKYEYDSLNNYKLLQQAFNKLDISKPVDCENLGKAKPQDNLEFLQWLKVYFDKNYKGEIKVVESRPAEQVHEKKSNKHVSGVLNKVASKENLQATANKEKSTKDVPRPNDENVEQNKQELTNYNKEIITKLQRTEKERDFYLSKLKDIEYLFNNEDKLKQEDFSVTAVNTIKEIIFSKHDVKLEITDEGALKIKESQEVKTSN